jgi:Protein of unknown function (DUF3096)
VLGGSDPRSAADLVDFLELGAASVRGYLAAGHLRIYRQFGPKEPLLAQQEARAARAPEPWEDAMEIVVLQPIVALIAGILILIMPHLLNYIVAIYLILIGLVGLIGQLG